MLGSLLSGFSPIKLFSGLAEWFNSMGWGTVAGLFEKLAGMFPDVAVGNDGSSNSSSENAGGSSEGADQDVELEDGVNPYLDATEAKILESLTNIFTPLAEYSQQAEISISAGGLNADEQKLYAAAMGVQQELNQLAMDMNANPNIKLDTDDFQNKINDPKNQILANSLKSAHAGHIIEALSSIDQNTGFEDRMAQIFNLANKVPELATVTQQGVQADETTETTKDLAAYNVQEITESGAPGKMRTIYAEPGSLATRSCSTQVVFPLIDFDAIAAEQAQLAEAETEAAPTTSVTVTHPKNPKL